MTALAPITAYIRTKNEERMIGDVIRAAQQVASEVVIVDSGSTDKTIEIADALGARVIKAPWLGGGKQKRIGEDAARFDWLLDLDADEIVSAELADEIRAAFAHGEPEARVFELMMATCPPIGEPWLRFNLVDRRKLYDRRVVRQPDHANWDQFQIQNGVRIARLRAPLLHYSFRDLAQLEEKFNRNSTGRARDTKLKPMWVCAARLVFGKPFYFLNQYVRRGLWRAGWYGFAVAEIAAHGRWLKDAKMMEMHLRARAAPKT
ncbi:MAG: glycosyltransferase family 2 protein [Hyphomonadaceae bacterium]|nr:glycosyltransferase family 2 protein [Hyphomonadaceae bacterium]